ncbi:hypothetical protein H0194_04675 [Corynebacterium incognita]|uniref:Uncharacterized protein n=1 Tax=Corynebacterium incognita TaxID=2754725 RepID=A0A7G7CRQ9_9CORY|nr:hypothetical protein [Corynebacterium incognita]QNE90275.1 hypothetical protein H0194_04675 [Corynebacterium incognita]
MTKYDPYNAHGLNMTQLAKQAGIRPNWPTPKQLGIAQIGFKQTQALNEALAGPGSQMRETITGLTTQLNAITRATAINPGFMEAITQANQLAARIARPQLKIQESLNRSLRPLAAISAIDVKTPYNFATIEAIKGSMRGYNELSKTMASIMDIYGSTKPKWAVEAALHSPKLREQAQEIAEKQPEVVEELTEKFTGVPVAELKLLKASEKNAAIAEFLGYFSGLIYRAMDGISAERWLLEFTTATIIFLVVINSQACAVEERLNDDAA